MRRALAVSVMAAALAACPGPPGPDPDATATATATSTPAPTATATAASNGARAVSEETDDFLFEFSYPSQAGRIPELAALLDRRLERTRAELAAGAEQARRQAREDGFPYNKHSHSSEWRVVADLPGWLSLSEQVATYTGGAHGNATMRSLVWDREAGRALDAIAMFTSPAALEKALGDRFCKGLDRERAKRRGAPVAADSQDQFDQCPRIDELEVLIGSSNKRTFNRLTLYAGPYVAGPYAEGAYEVNLDINRAILDAVKPEFRSAFTARN